MIERGDLAGDAERVVQRKKLNRRPYAQALGPRDDPARHQKGRRQNGTSGIDEHLRQPHDVEPPRLRRIDELEQLDERLSLTAPTSYLLREDSEVHGVPLRRSRHGGDDPSDPALRQELGVVALPWLRLLDLLGRVELREVHDLDVVPGPLEGVLVNERPRGVDAHRAREADVALRPLAVAGRAALRRLKGLSEAALADGQDVLLRVHARRERPQDVLDVVDVDVLVDDDAEPGAQRDRQGGGQNITLQSLVAGAALLHLENHAAPISHPHRNVCIDTESGNYSFSQLQKAGFSHDSVYEVLVHAVHDQTVVERPVGLVGDRRRLELVGAIRLAHVAGPFRMERVHPLRLVLLGERALPDLLRRVDVALDDVLRAGDGPGVLRPRLDELDREALERARDPELVAAARQDHVREAGA